MVLKNLGVRVRMLRSSDPQYIAVEQTKASTATNVPDNQLNHHDNNNNDNLSNCHDHHLLENRPPLLSSSNHHSWY
jgi:hypothetical protein